MGCPQATSWVVDCSFHTMFGPPVSAAAAQIRATSDMLGLPGSPWDAPQADYLTARMNSLILYMLVAYRSGFDS
jgi:hypothetical protein